MNLHELTSLNLSKDASKCSEFMAAPIFQQKYMTSKNDTQVGLINDDLFIVFTLSDQ